MYVPPANVCRDLPIFDSAISADAKWVVYEEPTVVNGFAGRHLMQWSAETGQTEEVVVMRNNNPDFGTEPRLTGDGSQLFYITESATDTLGRFLWVRDRSTGAIGPVHPSLGPDQVGAGYVTEPSISTDGRFVAFTANLAPGPDVPPSSAPHGYTFGERIFLVDRATGDVQVVGPQHARQPHVSNDGRFVAYVAKNNPLLEGDDDEFEDVFIFDRVTGSTRRVTPGDAQLLAGYKWGEFLPKFDMSLDGRYVLAGLVDQATRSTTVFRYDMRTGEALAVAPGERTFFLSISDDGSMAQYFNGTRQSAPRLRVWEANPAL